MKKQMVFAAVMGALAVQATEIPYDSNTTVSTPLVLTEDTTITVASSKTVTYDANAVISGAYKLTKQGDGKLNLYAKSTFSGGLDIAAGDLVLFDADAAGTGPVAQKAGTSRLYLGTSMTFTNAISLAAYGNCNFRATLIAKTGADVSLTGPLTYNSSWISTESATSVLRLKGPVTGSTELFVNPGGGLVIFEDRPVDMTGATLVLAGGGKTRFAVAGNTVPAISFKEKGTLQLGVAGAFATEPSLSLPYDKRGTNRNGGTVDLNGFDGGFGNLSVSSGDLQQPLSVVNTAGESATFTVNQKSAVCTIANIETSGPVSFAKKGSYDLAITNATFAVQEKLSVMEGALKLIPANDAKIAKTVALTSGATLDLGGRTACCDTFQMLGGTVVNGTLTAEKRGVFVESGTVTVSDANLAVYYPLDNAATLGRDLSGFANADLIATGTPVCTNDAKFGRAMFLNGTSALVNDVFPASLPTGSASWSTCIFLKHRNFVGGKYHPIGWGACSASQANFLQMVSATAFDHIIWSDTVLRGTLPSGNFADGWHSLVLTYDKESNTRTMYFDGVSVASGKVNRDGASRTPSVKAQDFSIGGQHNNEKNWEGWLDEAAVYRRALSAEEVASYHAKGVAGLNKPIPTGKIDTIEVASGATARICQTIEVSDVTGPGTVFTWGMTATDTISGCPKFVGDVALAADVTVDVTTVPGVGKENAVKLFEVADGVLNAPVEPTVTVNGTPFAGELRFVFKDGAYWAYQRSGLMLIFR